MNRRVAVLGAAMTIFGAALAPAADIPEDMKQAATKVAVEVCSACHGPGGHSTSPTFPILSAQQPTYLAAQLRAFQNRSRADPDAHDYMWGMAATVDSSLVDALAGYFAKQPAPPGTPGDAALIAEGKKLFEHGNAKESVPACAGCHGENAHGSTIFPRLAGQHAAYIVRQLQVIQDNLRSSPVMHGIVKDLSPEEIKAVAEYVQSLS